MGAYMSCQFLSGSADKDLSTKVEHNQYKNATFAQDPSNVRHHNKKKQPYLMPDSYMEIDRLDIQYYAVQLVCDRRYFAPLEEPKRAIDLGTGSGTWLLEMASDFPGCEFVGIDIEPWQPTTIRPLNCSFELGDILKGIPRPDNWFDYIHQQFLGGHIPEQYWQKHINECVRVCTSGGWIEIVETDCISVDCGPNGHQLSVWIRETFKAQGIDIDIVSRLDELMKNAGLLNVTKQTYILPLGDWGGKAGKLFEEDLRLLIPSIQKYIADTVGVTEEEVEAVAKATMEEAAHYRSHNILYVYLGQKR